MDSFALFVTVLVVLICLAGIGMAVWIGYSLFHARLTQGRPASYFEGLEG